MIDPATSLQASDTNGSHPDVTLAALLALNPEVLFEEAVDANGDGKAHDAVVRE